MGANFTEALKKYGIRPLAAEIMENALVKETDEEPCIVKEFLDTRSSYNEALVKVVFDEISKAGRFSTRTAHIVETATERAAKKYVEALKIIGLKITDLC